METKKVFFGKLNSDAGSNLLQDGDYLNAINVNIVNPDDKNVGDVIGTVGNQKIQANINQWLDGDSHKVVKAISDEDSGRIIYFLHPITSGATDYSYIFCYDKNTEETYCVLSGHSYYQSWLQLGQSYFTRVRNDGGTIEGTSCVYEFIRAHTGGSNEPYIDDVYIDAVIKDSFLFWTDGINPPMKLNIDRCIKYYHPSYSADVSPFVVHNSEISDLYLAKKAPTHPPFLDNNTALEAYPEWEGYGYGWAYKEGFRINSGTSNLLGNNSFLFATRFIYTDGEISVPSPYSPVVQPPQERDRSKNGIRVKYVESGSAPYDVQYVELLVKYGNSGVTYIADRINAYNYSSATYDFFNDSLGTALSDDYISRDFESVPLVSKTIDVARNRIILGNNTDGYDTPSLIDMDLSKYHVSTENTDPKYYSVEVIRTSVKILEVSRYWSGTHLRNFYLTVLPITVGGKIRYYINPYIRVTSGKAFNSTDWQSNTNVAFSDYIYLGESISSIETSGGEAFEPINDYTERRKFVTPSSVPAENLTVSDIPTNFTKYPLEGDILYSSESKYDFGVAYYDEFRRKSMVVYGGTTETPPLNYGLYPIEFDTVNYPVRWVEWTINSGDIPSWATQYQIVRTKSLSKNYSIQFKAQGIRFAYRYNNDKTIKESGDIESSAAGSALVCARTNTSGAWNLATNVYNENVEAIAIPLDSLNSLGIGYTYAEGDLVRVISKRYNTMITGSPLRVADVSGGFLFAYADSIPDIETLGSVSQEITESTTTDFIGNINYTFEREYHCEIYSPNQADKNYYEVSKVYDIVDGDYSVTSGKIRGDVYVNNEKIHPKEVMNRGDNWSSWETDAMRPNSDTDLSEDLGQEEKLTSIKWSGNYINGTKVNNLNTFSAFDEEIISEKIGDIKKVLTVAKVSDYGSVMLVIGTVGTVSVYVNERILSDTENSDQVVQTSAFIGTIRQLAGEYGTQNPESVAVYNGMAYWFDKNKASVIRYSSAGLHPISDYGMKAFFRKVSPYITTAIGGIDPYTNEYLIAIPEINSSYIEYPTDYAKFNICDSYPVGDALSVSWSNQLCAQTITYYAVTWDTHLCATEGTSYTASWTDYICAQENKVMSAYWGNYLCVESPGTYSAGWFNYVCSQVLEGDTYDATWEDEVCVDV